MRKFSHHARWTSLETEIVSRHFRNCPWSELLAMLPGRSHSQIQNKANLMGMVRDKKPKMTPEQIRESKRVIAAKRRAEDPQRARDYSLSQHYRNHERSCRLMRDYYYKRFFWSKAMRLRSENRATYKELASIWKRQKGKCALTGRRLTREAHLDHILAKAKGGNDNASNLRWVCREVNLARREMSDADFIKLCKDVMSWIGQRIDMCDEVLRSIPTNATPQSPTA